MQRLLISLQRLFNTKYLVLYAFIFLAFTAFHLLNITKTPIALAQVAPSDEPDISCIAPFVSDYMNKVIDGAGNLPHIKLLSPAFNMTSRFFSPLVDGMGTSGARFRELDGIAGNAYNGFGTPITGHVNSAMGNGYISGMPVFLTETGNFDTTDLGLLQTELSKIKQDDGQDYIGGTLFNVFGTNQNDSNGDGVPDFQHGILSDSDLDRVCGGSGKCGVIGVNSADFYPKGEDYYLRAQNHGMQFSLSIANGGYNAIHTIMPDIRNMRRKGITPVIRIWTVGGGFENPQTYVDLLRQISTLISSEGLNMTVYAIAGPNEPESDPWTLANCKKAEERKKFEPKDVPCNSTSDPEFHKFRPYPASPCNKSVVAENVETVALCANDLVVKQTFEVTRNECTKISGSDTLYECVKPGQAQISVNLDDAELPILGNTELVPNFINQDNLLDFKSRVNEYVSWYLNGVIGVSTEDPVTKPDDIINFSGPINKLMPLTRQFAKKIETITEGTAGKIRHNQVVGCASQVILGSTETITLNCMARSLVNLLFFGKYYLSDWLGKPVGAIIRPGDLGLTFLPPLEEDSANFTEFLRSFKNWKGWDCAPSPLPLICLPGSEPWYSKLFAYIPYPSTEDRKGALRLEHDKIPTMYPKGGCSASVSGGNTAICNAEFIRSGLPDIDRGHEILYFPHTEEVVEDSGYLQSTYLPKGVVGSENKITSDKQNVGIGPGCTILETRSNRGDDLYGEYDDPSGAEPGLLGTLNYTAKFACEFSSSTARTQCLASCVDLPSNQQECIDKCPAETNTCKKDVFVSLPMKTIVPRADEIWSRLVEGDFAVFKRFFPKFGPSTPVDKVVDIPGVTRGEYEAVGTNITPLSGNPNANKPGTSAEIYFPHLGGVSEYFLNGIQTALRPKGFGEAGALTGLPPSSKIPGSTPGTGKCETIPSGACSVDNLKGYFGNDIAKATNASQICNVESGGNEFALNDNCLRGTTYDYSVGLFQINLLAHSVVDPVSGQTLNCPSAFSVKDSSSSRCAIGDQSLLSRCVDILQNADNNINKAVEVSSNGTNWNPWSAAGVCGITSPGIQ